MEESPLRVGIAGTGFVGRIHARAARSAGADLVGVAASTPERGRQAARELGAGTGFASAEELAASDEVDVVHLCVPNNLHAPLAEAALDAGKPVICEKPLAADAESARRLAVAAGPDAGFVPFVYRYYPTVREARERARAGGIGEVRLLHGTYLQDWLLAPDDDNWRVDSELGGASRAFADIGSHWCDLAEFVSGHRIARLSARTMTAVPERVRAAGREAFEAGGGGGGGERRAVDTEDAAIVQFETDRGAMGALVVSQISAGRKNRLWLEVDGAEETLVFDQESPETLWCGRREGATVVPRDPQHMSAGAARLAVIPAGHPQGYQECFDAFVADAYAAIRTGDAPDGLPTFADGARAADVTDAVLRSARERAWVEVPAADQAEALT